MAGMEAVLKAEVVLAVVIEVDFVVMTVARSLCTR